MITTENIHTKSDQEITADLPCFGMIWNPTDQMCVGPPRVCAAQARCVHRMATVTLPQDAFERGAFDANHETGKMTARLQDLELQELATEHQTTIPALQYILEYAKDHKLGLPVMQPDGSLIPSMTGPPGTKAPETVPPVPETEEVDLDVVVDELAGKSPEPAPVPEPKKTKAARTPAPKVKKEIPPVKTKAKIKTPPKPLPKPKKEVKAIPPPRPQKASPKAQTDEAGTFQARFQRDLKRTKLDVGMVIKKQFRGEDEVHKITVTNEGHRYEGKLYPTLYALMIEMVGASSYPMQEKADGSRPKGTRTMADMSAPRFFNLKAQIKEAKAKK